MHGTFQIFFIKLYHQDKIIEEEMKNIFNLGARILSVVPTKAEIDVHKSIKKRGFNSDYWIK